MTRMMFCIGGDKSVVIRQGMASRLISLHFLVPFKHVLVLASEAESAAGPVHFSKAVLTEELKQKVVQQVEFYFSDSNLPTDKYLMKFVKNDQEGFVPIPVVASFRKLKSLVSNHSLVASALRTSLQLVDKEDGKKVRRLHPLTDIDIEEVQSRTVIAENLPSNYFIHFLVLLAV